MIELSLMIKLYRGWAQTEIPTEHDASIVQVLKPGGPFVQGLVYLSKFPEYSYDIATESLPVSACVCVLLSNIIISINLYTRNRMMYEKH